MKQERYDIHCDSQSALDLSKNVMYHSRTRHIDVRYHWLRQAVEEQQFKLEKIHTDENPADMMTKVITGGKLQLCAELIGMECIILPARTPCSQANLEQPPFAGVIPVSFPAILHTIRFVKSSPTPATYLSPLVVFQNFCSTLTSTQQRDCAVENQQPSVLAFEGFES
ncbi:Unknown protein [Striga hermonthica]|uniref:Uncharacterized protein n=1 Tax=Striga hermonthica TaxID=68872 RepID=A0A9N7NV97_STRHE|nr:Unknown protein [Striga hermonthica]